MLRAAQFPRSQSAALNLQLVTKRWQKAAGSGSPNTTSTTTAKPGATPTPTSSTPTYKATAPPLSAAKFSNESGSDRSLSKPKPSTTAYSPIVPASARTSQPPNSSKSSGKAGGSSFGGKIIKGVFYGVTLGLAGTIIYAEYDNGQFRRQLESTIPYSSTVLSGIDQFLDPILGRQRLITVDGQENKLTSTNERKEELTKPSEPVRPIVETVKDQTPTKTPIQKIGDQVKDTVSHTKAKLPDATKVKEVVDHTVDQAKSAVHSVRDSLPDSKSLKKNIESVKGKVEDTAHKVKDTIKETLPIGKGPSGEASNQINDPISKEESSEPAIPPPSPKEKYKELEEELQHLLTPLTQYIDEAVQAAQEHISHMKTLIDSSNLPQMNDETWKHAEQLQEKVKGAYEKVSDMFMQWKNKLIEYTTLTNGKIHPDEKKLDEKFQELQKQYTTSNFVRNFRTYIDDATRSFQKEIETMFPSLAGKNPTQLTQEDLQALLVHAHRRVVKLQSEIARMCVKEMDSVKEAVDATRAEINRNIEQEVQERVQRTTEQLTEELKVYEKNLRDQFDDQLRHEIVLQHHALTQYLADVLSRQYQEWTREYEKQLENESIKIHLNLQSQLRNTFDRLYAIEHAIETNHQSQQRARQAQQLWIQAQNLLHQIVQGTTTEADLENLGQIVPDEKFVQVLLNELKGDDLSNTNEELLRERFRHVSKLCRRFALIDDKHNSLWNYFLSYLQSLVIIEKRDDSILKDDAIDLNQLDTFKILNHVQTYLEHNQWYNALRMMQLLSGEPRNVAQSWINDARTYLAKKQTSELLEAYSNSIGLGTLPRKA